MSNAYVADVEEQALEVAELLRGKAQKSHVLVEDSTSELLVGGERIWSNARRISLPYEGEKRGFRTACKE